LTQNKLLKKCKTVIFLFIVFTLVSSVVSTAAFVLTGSGNMNNNIVFAKKSKGSGGSSKDNGGSSSDTSSPTESSSNDQGSNTPPPESDKNQKSSTGSEPEEQKQPPAADQTPCPDGSQPDANGNCPTPPSTQSTNPAAEGTGQQPPAQEQQQQCPTGQHFDTNQNTCVSDTSTQQQPAQGLVGSIDGLPPSALETGPGPASIGLCKGGSQIDPKIHACKPDYITCSGDTHYNRVSEKCVSDSEELPVTGECVPGYHLDSKLDPTGHTCYKDLPPPPPTTKASDIRVSRICSPGFSHYDPNTGKCVLDDNSDQNVQRVNGNCANTNEPTHYDPDLGTCAAGPPPPCSPGFSHYDPNTGKCKPDSNTKQCGVLGVPAHFDPDTGYCVPNSPPNPPSSTQTGDGGGTGTGGTIPTGQGGGTGTQQQPQTVKCGKDTHPDPKTGTCTVNDVPLANGACAAGYHFGKDQSICLKDTTTIPPKNCEAGSHYDTNYRDCIDDRYPILSKSGIGSSCVAGYHLEADKLCHKDTSTTTIPNQQTTCSTDQHLDSGKCVDNNVPLSNGKCVPGYHLDTRPAITKQVGFCIKDEPSSKAPSTESSTVPPINGACMEPAYHLGDDNLCHLDVITNTPAATPAQLPSISLSQPECVPGYHWDNSQLQCVADSK
jgi:hypothetical protein